MSRLEMAGGVTRNSTGACAGGSDSERGRSETASGCAPWRLRWCEWDCVRLRRKNAFPAEFEIGARALRDASAVILRLR